MKKIIPEGDGSIRTNLPDDFWGNIKKACEEMKEKKKNIFLLLEKNDIDLLKTFLSNFPTLFSMERKGREQSEFVLNTIQDCIREILNKSDHDQFVSDACVSVMACDPSLEPIDINFFRKGSINNLVIWIHSF